MFTVILLTVYCDWALGVKCCLLSLVRWTTDVKHSLLILLDSVREGEIPEWKVWLVDSNCLPQFIYPFSNSLSPPRSPVPLSFLSFLPPPLPPFSLLSLPPLAPPPRRFTWVPGHSSGHLETAFTSNR